MQPKKTQRKRTLKYNGKIKDQNKRVAEGPTYAAGAFSEISKT